jgi:hypothetical protein
MTTSNSVDAGSALKLFEPSFSSHAAVPFCGSIAGDQHSQDKDKDLKNLILGSFS